MNSLDLNWCRYCGATLREGKHTPNWKPSVTHDGKHYRSRLYHTWIGMKRRCHNENDKDYKWYGAKGAVVCDEWRNDYAAYRTWALENGYGPGLVIDRIDGQRGYEPDNCHWITHADNQPRRKLTRTDVQRIRKSKLPRAALAEHYDVHDTHIMRIQSGEAWPSLPWDEETERQEP